MDLLDHLLGERLIAHLDDGVLAAAARLLDVARLDLDRPGQCLPVGHHRLADGHFHAVIALQLVHRDLQVQLAHAA